MPYVSGSRVARWAYNAGFRGANLIIHVAIAKAESGWNTSARNHTSREDSRGLWQINVNAHPWGRSINLYNGQTNAHASRRVYREAGSRWRPWSVYIHGTYIKYLNDAYAACRLADVGVTKTHYNQARDHAIRQFPELVSGAVSQAGTVIANSVAPLLSGSWSHQAHLYSSAKWMGIAAGRMQRSISAIIAENKRNT